MFSNEIAIAFLVIRCGPQVWGVRNLGQEEMNWLHVLAERIKNSYVTTRRPEVGDGVDFGIFSFKRFRDFLRESGYDDAIADADTVCRLTKAG